MPRIALTVHSSRPDAPLSPFFGKARGLLVIDQEGSEQAFLPNLGWNGEWVCATLFAHDVKRLICAYIDGKSSRRLDRAGIDARLAPCSQPALGLVARFDGLPKATGNLPPGPALATLDGVLQRRHA